MIIQCLWRDVLPFSFTRRLRCIRITTILYVSITLFEYFFPIPIITYSQSISYPVMIIYISNMISWYIKTFSKPGSLAESETSFVSMFSTILSEHRFVSVIHMRVCHRIGVDYLMEVEVYIRKSLTDIKV